MALALILERIWIQLRPKSNGDQNQKTVIENKSGKKLWINTIFAAKKSCLLDKDRLE